MQKLRHLFGMVFRPDLIELVKTDRAEGVKTFLKKGGRFKPEAKTADGETEAMTIAAYAKTEGLKLFVENSGKFNPAVQNSWGETEAMVIVKYTGAEGLQLFADNGGLLTLMLKQEIP